MHAREQSEPMPPFYIHLPSVRPMVAGTLAKWFVHAIEARAAPEARKVILAELSRQKQAALDAESPNAEHLTEVINALKERRLGRRRQAAGEIHFVVVDNAVYYHEKPMNETHTPQALQLARALNGIGNQHGVYVHYVTPAEIQPWLLAQYLPSLYAHKDGWKLKVGPGEGTNIALAYVRAYHQRHYRGKARLLRMSDDTAPITAKTQVELANGTRTAAQYRNFFADQERIITGGLDVRKAYQGYADATGNLVSQTTHYNSVFLVRYAHPNDIPYYHAGKDEDLYYRAPASVETFRTPTYLRHAGKESTWRLREGMRIFSHEYSQQEMAIPPELVETITRASGIRSEPSS